jgi:hypothetical protein
MEQHRQGDVFLMEVSDLPKKLTEVKKGSEHQRDGYNVLAFGEVTGHYHGIVSKACKMYHDGAGGAYVQIGVSDTQLLHQEHSPISLKAGQIFKVTIQREFTPEAVRNVAD